MGKSKEYDYRQKFENLFKASKPGITLTGIKKRLANNPSEKEGARAAFNQVNGSKSLTEEQAMATAFPNLRSIFK